MDTASAAGTNREAVQCPQGRCAVEVLCLTIQHRTSGFASRPAGTRAVGSTHCSSAQYRVSGLCVFLHTLLGVASDSPVDSDAPVHPPKPRDAGSARKHLPKREDRGKAFGITRCLFGDDDNYGFYVVRSTTRDMSLHRLHRVRQLGPLLYGRTTDLCLRSGRTTGLYEHGLGHCRLPCAV
ncbi:hypothetical protein BV20DRAFT_759272 [Pilatotrama ljubarskyi]|nr:hypothetical protein BV20DRAFT_759272 [Pilatotrama ljubarskyi]